MNLKTSIRIKKQHILLGIVFGFIAILLPFHWAGAGLGNIIIDATRFIVLAGISSVLLVLVPLSLGLFKLSEIVLSWSISPELFGNVTDNAFVMTGWGVIRDFSNMFFVLIFVAIGIAAALRIKEYEIKKILPRLIGVALLINFSPIICGLVIDAANIFINFFLTAGASGFNDAISLSTTAGDQYITTVRSAWGNWHQFHTGVFFFRLLGVFIFNIFGSVVLLLFTVLFLIRNIAIWILVILSPLAFLSYILPATKKTIFDRWRKEFIQWSFIGVAGAFFIYLSQLMLSIQVSQIKAPPTETMEFGEGGLSALIVMTIPILFLLVGFFVTLSTSVTGAKTVTSLAKKGFKAYDPTTKKGREAIQRLKGGVKGGTARVAARIPGVQKRAQGILAKTPEERQEEWNKASGLGRAGKIAGRMLYSYKRREKLAAAVTGNVAQTKLKKAHEAKEKADKLKTGEARRAEWKAARTKEGRFGAMESIIENREFAGYSKAEQKRAIENAASIHPDAVKKIYKAAPHVAIELRNEYNNQMQNAIKQKQFSKAQNIKRKMDGMGLLLSEGDREKGYKTFGHKIADSIQTKDIPFMDPAAFKNKEFLAGTTKFWAGNKAKAVERELGRPGIQGLQQGIDEMGMDNLKKENFSLYKSVEGNAGAQIGLGDSDPDRAKIRRQEREKTEGKTVPTIQEAQKHAEDEEEFLKQNLITLGTKKKGKKKKRKRKYVDRD